jgi:nucleotide-binding universal stress UspA family protein
VATDFTPVSETALVYGRAFARTFGGRLHVLHVVDDFATHFSYPHTAIGSGPSDFQAEIKHAARKALETVVTETDRRELQAVATLRVNNSTATGIVDYAKEAAIDLVVIGATGRGAIDRMLMGSVADKVIRQASCPVLTVRNPEHEFVIPDALQRMTHVLA